MGGGGKIPRAPILNNVDLDMENSDRLRYAGTPRKFGPPLVVGTPSQATGRPTPPSWALSSLELLPLHSALVLTESTAIRCPRPADSSLADSQSFPDL